MGITRLVYALFATMKSKRADGRDMSVMAWLRQLRTGITCVESPNWRCEAWQDGVLVLSTPARLELGESVWTLPDSLKLPRLSQPHVLAVQLRFLLGP